MAGRFEGTLTDFLRQTVPDGLDRGLSVLEFGDLTYSGAFLLETLPVTLFIIARHGDDPDHAIRAAVNHTRDERHDRVARRERDGRPAWDGRLPAGLGRGAARPHRAWR